MKKNIIRESTSDVDLFIRMHSMRQVGRHKEFDKEFARELENALEQFADKKGMTPDEVMAAGDRTMNQFANWAKKNLRLDIDKNMPGADEFVEGRGSEPVDEFFISNWIGDELQDCEWVDPSEIQYAGDEPWVEISTYDGDVYRIQVTKVYSGKLGTYLDER